MEAIAGRLPDYVYYLENYDDARRLVSAEPIVAKYRERNGCATNAWVAILALIGFVIVGLTVMLGGHLSAGTALVAVAACVIAIILLKRWQHGKEYQESKRVVDALEGQFDRSRFVVLDNEFGDEARARELKNEAEKRLATFFQGGSRPPELTSSQASKAEAPADAAARPLSPSEMYDGSKASQSPTRNYRTLDWGGRNRFLS